MEHFFACPYCGEQISMVLDTSVPRQSYIEDCEVCCRPIEVRYTVEEHQRQFRLPLTAPHPLRSYPPSTPQISYAADVHPASIQRTQPEQSSEALAHCLSALPKSAIPQSPLGQPETKALPSWPKHAVIVQCDSRPDRG